MTREKLNTSDIKAAKQACPSQGFLLTSQKLFVTNKQSYYMDKMSIFRISLVIIDKRLRENPYVFHISITKVKYMKRNGIGPLTI